MPVAGGHHRRLVERLADARLPVRRGPAQGRGGPAAAASSCRAAAPCRPPTRPVPAPPRTRPRPSSARARRARAPALGLAAGAHRLPVAGGRPARPPPGRPRTRPPRGARRRAAERHGAREDVAEPLGQLAVAPRQRQRRLELAALGQHGRPSLPRTQLSVSGSPRSAASRSASSSSSLGLLELGRARAGPPPSPSVPRRSGCRSRSRRRRRGRRRRVEDLRRPSLPAGRDPRRTCARRQPAPRTATRRPGSPGSSASAIASSAAATHSAACSATPGRAEVSSFSSASERRSPIRVGDLPPPRPPSASARPRSIPSRQAYSSCCIRESSDSAVVSSLSLEPVGELGHPLPEPQRVLRAGCARPSRRRGRASAPPPASRRPPPCVGDQRRPARRGARPRARSSPAPPPRGWRRAASASWVP